MALNVGLVGHGRWGSRHLDTLLTLKKSGKIGSIFVCDTDEKQLRNLPPGVDATYSTSQDLFNLKSLDCVAIVTPPSTHLELASQAIAKGFPVFVEKPLSDQMADVSDFLDSLHPETTLISGFLLRHHHGIQAIQQLLSNRKIGALRELHYYRTTKRDRPKGAQAMTTLGIHGFDLSILFGMDELMSVKPYEFISEPGKMKLDARGPRDTRILIDVSWNAAEEKRNLTLVGEQGELVLTFGSTPHLAFNSGEATQSLPISNDTTPLALEWEFFLTAALSGTPTVYPSKTDLLLLNRWLSTLTE